MASKRFWDWFYGERHTEKSRIAGTWAAALIIVSLVTVLGILVALTLWPVPQRISASIHCASLKIINNTPYFHIQDNITPTFSNCTIVINATATFGLNRFLMGN